MLFRSNPQLVIKGGIFDGKAVTTAEILKLADLESREVLLAKLAGAMKGSLAKAVRTIDALRAKKEAAEGAPAPKAEAPAAPEAESAPAPVEASAPEATVAEATPAAAEAVVETPTAQDSAE